MKQGKSKEFSGFDGFSLARWLFWKQRFREFSIFAQPSEETRELYRQTVKLMEGFEAGEAS